MHKRARKLIYGHNINSHVVKELIELINRMCNSLPGQNKATLVASYYVLIGAIGFTSCAHAFKDNCNGKGTGKSKDILSRSFKKSLEKMDIDQRLEVAIDIWNGVAMPQLTEFQKTLADLYI